jgi:hypothetical protein
MDRRYHDAPIAVDFDIREFRLWMFLWVAVPTCGTFNVATGLSSARDEVDLHPKRAGRNGKLTPP